MVYARNTWRKLAAQTPTNHHGRGCWVKFRPVWKRAREAMYVIQSLWEESVLARRVWLKLSGGQCNHVGWAALRRICWVAISPAVVITLSERCSYFTWNKCPGKTLKKRFKSKTDKMFGFFKRGQRGYYQSKHWTWKECCRENYGCNRWLFSLSSVQMPNTASQSSSLFTKIAPIIRIEV